MRLLLSLLACTTTVVVVGLICWPSASIFQGAASLDEVPLDIGVFSWNTTSELVGLARGDRVYVWCPLQEFCEEMCKGWVVDVPSATSVVINITYCPVLDVPYFPPGPWIISPIPRTFCKHVAAVG